MQSIVTEDEIIDIENVSFLEPCSPHQIRQMDAIFNSKPQSNISVNSPLIDDDELFCDLFTPDNEDGYDQDDISLTDSDSMDLSNYLVRNSSSKPRRSEMEHDLELLDRQTKPLQNILKTHVLIPVQDLRNKDIVKHLSSNEGDCQNKVKLASCGSDGDSQSLSKNAISARENRLKKKEYLSHLEKTVKLLSEQNRKLTASEIEKDAHIETLKTEVEYLHNVLANQSTLSALLQNIHKTPGVRFADSRPVPTESNKSDQPCQTSLLAACQNIKQGILKRKASNEERSIPSDNSKLRRLTRSKTISLKENEERVLTKNNRECARKPTTEVLKQFSGGICLHVTGQQVSLEFCAQCNQKSSSSSISSDHSYVQQQLKFKL